MRVSAGQLLFSLGTPANAAFPAATALQVTGTGAYNLGLPTGTGSITVGAWAHIQTYASVVHASSGTFDTGAGTITVSGTYTNQAVGATTVTAGGTLSANQLALNGVVTAAPGALTVESDVISGVGARVGTLTVGAGGLTLADRSIRLTGTVIGANVGAVLNLNGDVTSGGASSIVGVGTNPHRVNLNAAGGLRTVTVSSGALTISAPVANGTGAGTLVKAGPGDLVLTAVNPFTSFVRVDAGRLVALGGFALPDTVAGGTGTAGVTLNGGTLSVHNPAAGANEAGSSERAASFALTANSSLQLGTGAHTLRFTSDRGSATVPAGLLLTVSGWAGTAGQSGTAGQIVFTDPPGEQRLAGPGAVRRLPAGGDVHPVHRHRERHRPVRVRAGAGPAVGLLVAAGLLVVTYRRGRYTPPAG